MKNTGLVKIKEGLVEVKDGIKGDVKDLELKSKVKGFFKKTKKTEEEDEDMEDFKEKLEQHLEITKGFVEHFEKLMKRMEEEESEEDA